MNTALSDRDARRWSVTTRTDARKASTNKSFILVKLYRLTYSDDASRSVIGLLRRDFFRECIRHQLFETGSPDIRITFSVRRACENHFANSKHDRSFLFPRLSTPKTSMSSVRDLEFACATPLRFLLLFGLVATTRFPHPWFPAGQTARRRRQKEFTRFHKSSHLDL